MIKLIKNLRLKDVTVNVSYGGYAGGLAASNSGTITNCSAAGNVSLSTSAYPYNDFISYDHAGGLVGHNSGTITNCYSTATVKLSSHGNESYGYAGGLVGYNYKGIITNCYATGTVRSNARHINYPCAICP